VAQGAALTACAAIQLPAHGEGGWAPPKSLGPPEPSTTSCRILWPFRVFLVPPVAP